MKQAGFSTIITLSGVKHIRLIMVCAWCPKNRYQPLKKNEEYSHGICKTHLTQVTKERIAKRQDRLSV